MPILFWGCTAGRGPSTGDGSLPAPELIAPPDKSQGYQDSRTIASHNLTSQGYELLERGDIDGALRLLERAVGINPSDGPGYYYLAEAWIAKDNLDLASRFNSLASIYLRKDRTWTRQAKDQKRRIDAKRNDGQSVTPSQ
ncbi:hypothetical protein DSLASN_13610 [Desulfoluna limicola]|uniref:Tetratricopeptide repeat protein n=1 Tax=Desulfoluna limicola TaxID=2810562 RepID=A0ABM7PER8_9BACT|nr:tetratricopeptide repeat protein [Desulfoluna limicola]BCS95729.1 hypothetical protein DSLASN_13610 [Desulfoluna limicola]